MDAAKEYYFKDETNISFLDNKYKALNNADALVLVTEWKEFRSPDFYEISERIKNKIIFDGRNQYDIENLERMGFEYYHIGNRQLIIPEKQYLRKDSLKSTALD